MTYRRKKRLSWTLIEKDRPPVTDLFLFIHLRCPGSDLRGAVGTVSLSYGNPFPGGKSLPGNSFSVLTPSGNVSISNASSGKIRPTSSSKGKSNESIQSKISVQRPRTRQGVK
jgi:hypothetical protein